MKIKEENKPKILASLFNKARTQGMGILHYQPEHQMDEEEARNLLKQSQHFDYLEGRVMKVDLSTDELNTELYNRDNGIGAAEDVINSLNLK